MATYQLTNFCGKWWNGKRWTKKVKGGCCTHRNLGKDGRRAWKLFYEVREEDFILMKWHYDKGVRCLQEWRWGKPEDNTNAQDEIKKII